VWKQSAPDQSAAWKVVTQTKSIVDLATVFEPKTPVQQDHRSYGHYQCDQFSWFCHATCRQCEQQLLHF